MAVSGCGEVVIGAKGLTLDFPTPRDAKIPRQRPSPEAPRQEPGEGRPQAASRHRAVGRLSFRALDDVSFVARRGDRIGLIGHAAPCLAPPLPVRCTLARARSAARTSRSSVLASAPSPLR